jgi:hypothetical protein
MKMIRKPNIDNKFDQKDDKGIEEGRFLPIQNRLFSLLKNEIDHLTMLFEIFPEIKMICEDCK